MSLGAGVRERRIAAKVQQKDLAAYLGVTHQKMNAWELGRQTMPNDVFDQAVGALDHGVVPKSSSKLSIIGRKDDGVGDAVMTLFADSVASMKDGTLPDVTDLLADEIAAIERAAREMQDAEWQRLADMSSAAERLGWRASMTVIDGEPEYIIEAGGRHASVAPDDVEAFMRGAAWAQ